MKQYLTSLALLIAALVAFPTSHANAQSETEMNRQAAKPTIRYETMAELTQQRIKQLKARLAE